MQDSKIIREALEGRGALDERGPKEGLLDWKLSVDRILNDFKNQLTVLEAKLILPPVEVANRSLALSEKTAGRIRIIFISLIGLAVGAFKDYIAMIFLGG